MRVTHHQQGDDVTADVYKVLDDEGPDVYFLRLRAGKGRGGATEPVVVVEFSPRELRDFAVELIGLVALENDDV